MGAPTQNVVGAPYLDQRDRCGDSHPLGQPENDSAVRLFRTSSVRTVERLLRRFGYVGPGTVAVPGATGPLCRGAANGPQYGGGAICANAGPATVIAAMPKTLI